MCKAYKKTQDVVRLFSRRESFTKEELYNAIRQSGGVMRIRAGYSVKDYLEDLEYLGEFTYISSDMKYTKARQRNLHK